MVTLQGMWVVDPYMEQLTALFIYNKHYLYNTVSLPGCFKSRNNLSYFLKLFSSYCLEHNLVHTPKESRPELALHSRSWGAGQCSAGLRHSSEKRSWYSKFLIYWSHDLPMAQNHLRFGIFQRGGLINYCSLMKAKRKNGRKNLQPCKITHETKIIFYQRRNKQLRNEFILAIVMQ